MTQKDIRAFKVYAIEHGTVIDHIPAARALKILTLLGLDTHDHVTTIGLNFESKKTDYKDVIKIEGKELTPHEANIIALFAPDATINIIRNFEVAKKFSVTIPEHIEHLIVCPNPMCITNHETMDTRFDVHRTTDKVVHVQCTYCEKQFAGQDIKTYNI